MDLNVGLWLSSGSIVSSDCFLRSRSAPIEVADIKDGQLARLIFRSEGSAAPRRS
jgi:hypothetical protein